MQVGFATADWAVRADSHTETPTYGGSGWARIGLPAKFLAAEGWSVVEGTLVWARDLGRFGVKQWPTKDDPFPEPVIDLDLIVLQRWMFATVAEECLIARSNGQVVVNDVDDDFWSLDRRNRAYLTTSPKRNAHENRDHYAAVLRNSSAVTVSTPSLADAVRKLGVRCPVHVLPNHVDLDVYKEIRDANRLRLALRSYEGPTRYGWVGATSWRSGDLETLRGVLGPFLEASDAEGYHGGHIDQEGVGTFADQAGVAAARMVTAKMVPITRYPGLFAGLDVGLIPLRDVAFNRAKSWIKGLEYAAAGVPFIAQDLPEYVRLHVNHGMGHLVRRPRDWRSALDEMLVPGCREEQVEANLAGAKALDIRQGISQWRNLYLCLLAAS